MKINWESGWVHVALIAIAFIAYAATSFQFPLVDYDEATYAKLVVDTLHGGDWLGFQLSGEVWLQKPPLYYWLAMGAATFFGEYAWAFRWPSILASTLCAWLTYLIARELVNRRAAIIAFFILLFSPLFYVFAREARPDSGMIMGMLAALYFFIRGWQDEKKLLWVFPAIAVGLLFKNAIALLIIPIILLYAAFYGKWSPLRSKYLWIGFGLSLLIFLPWHIIEALRYGEQFWDSYVASMLFYRAFEQAAGGTTYFDYLPVIWESYRPWVWVLLVSFISMPLLRRFSKDVAWKPYLASLISGALLIGIFSFAKTHLSTYIMPAFPLLAIAGAIAIESIAQFVRRTYLFIIATSLLIVLSAVLTFSAMYRFVTPFYYEERDIGKIYAAREESAAQLYVLQWPHQWTLSYYGKSSIHDVKVAERGKKIEGPLYLTTTTYFAPYFESKKGVEVLFRGQFLVLLYSPNDLTIQFKRD